MGINPSLCHYKPSFWPVYKKVCPRQNELQALDTAIVNKTNIVYQHIIVDAFSRMELIILQPLEGDIQFGADLARYILLRSLCGPRRCDATNRMHDPAYGADPSKFMNIPDMHKPSNTVSIRGFRFLPTNAVLQPV